MPKLTPAIGGGVRLTPNGDSTYASKPFTPEDPLEGAGPEERRFFIDTYGPLTMLEMCRRLRVAEWNAAEYQRRAEEWKAATDRANRKLAVAMDRIQASPPEGYSMPAAAEQLLGHAEAHGWTTKARWTAPDAREPFLKVAVGHGGWLYELTWHSRDCQPGRVRLFSGVARTPDRPAPHDAPSVKAIRAVIETNSAGQGATAA